LAGPGEVLVVVKASLPTAPTVVWWQEPAPAAGSSPAPTAAAGTPTTHRVTARRTSGLWIARLTDLPIGPRIGYRVESARGASEDHRFRVGVAAGESFRFAAFGDTRTHHDVHRAVIEALAREHVDFVLHTGDMVERGGVDAQWDTFFQIERPLLANAPIVPAIGNHDLGRADYYRRYFALRRWTGGRRYYTFDRGNLRVVVIDIDLECRAGCTQYAYAERALEEGASRGMLMVILTHHPPYSSGSHGSDLAMRRSIGDLARTWGVELVIAGHDHDYERTRPIDGVTYVVSGSAGAPIRPVRPSWFTASARTEPHYVLVDVEADRLTVRAINLRGETFDSAVLPANPPRLHR
jgi:predicted phosphodiesterase